MMPDRARTMLDYLLVRFDGDAVDAQRIASVGVESSDWYAGYAAGLRAGQSLVADSIRYLDNVGSDWNDQA
jgi:hypothetical protein